jgi:acetyl-CoA carboxylase biotin carboxyl carrier protein
MLKKRVQEIIDLVEQNNVHEIEVSTWWGRKIRVTKNAQGTGTNGIGVPVTVLAPNHNPGVAEAPLVQAPESPPSELLEDLSRYQEIRAPIVGTFYRRPSPESPPYINIGDRITKGQIICIIEAMKIMNEIESDVSGTVVDILVEDTSPVEYNQELVRVEPS